MDIPVSLTQGPEPVETTDLHFKLICKLKVFETSEKNEGRNCNLLAVSQYFGLVFVGNVNGFTVLSTNSINASLNYNEYPKEDFVLNLKPSHISVDFSQKTLAVVCRSKLDSVLILYNIASLSSKGTSPLRVNLSSKTTPNSTSEVIEMAWQPNTDSKLIFCMSDGSVLALSQPYKEAMLSLPSSTQATCFSWSPKGKQIVVGSIAGTLSQYKPDLKLVKTLPPPPLFNGAVTVVSILWLSSYQFAVAYNDKNNLESFPVITIVNATKNEPINVINYDDITFSSTLFRSHQLYMCHQSTWNLIFVSSANSMEVAVLHSKDGFAWEQWLLGDASRAELPLNADRQETFPLGLAFDFTNKDVVPWGEGTLPPMPRLLLLSDEGVLCIFNVVNATVGALQLCSPPRETLPGLVFAVKPTVTRSLEMPNTPQTSKLFPAPVLGNSKFSYNFNSNSGFGAFTVQSSQNTTSTTTVFVQSDTGNNKELQKQPVANFQQQQPLVQQLPQKQLQIQGHLQPFQKQEEGEIINSDKFMLITTTSKFSSLCKPQPNTTTLTYSFGTKPSGSKTIFPMAALTPPSTTFKPKTPSGLNDIFATKDLIQSTPIKQPEVQKVPNPVLIVKKAEETEVQKKTQGKTHNFLGSGNLDPATLELPVVDDSVYWNALQEEIDHFSSDLEQLASKIRSLDMQVGTEENKTKMRQGIDGLYDFWRDLKETTMSQSNEIHSVVMDLMESFAWLENAKSRNLLRKNPSFIELKKSEELDPLSSRHMTDIFHYKYYIETQLKQLSTYLEKEWMDHQENYRFEIKNQMAVPTSEEIYKTMHLHLKILSKQRALIEELKEKNAAEKRKNKLQPSISTNSISISSNKGTNRVSELSKLAENLLQLKIQHEDFQPKFENGDLIKSQLKAISGRWKNLTSDKQATLRDVLSERGVVTIRPVKTTFESSSFLRSFPSKKTASKSFKLKPEETEKEEKTSSATLSKGGTHPTPKAQERLDSKSEKVEAKVEEKKAEAPKSVFVFGVTSTPEKPTIPFNSKTPPSKLEEKSPLASLSGIVFNLGKENESQQVIPSSFSHENSNFQNQEVPKKPSFFSVDAPTSEQELKEGKAPSFLICLKSEEKVFGKPESSKLNITQTTPSSQCKFGFDPSVSTSDKSVTIFAPPACTTVTTSSSQFSFSFNTTTTITTTSSQLSSTFPKVSSLFEKDEQPLGFKAQNSNEGLFTNPATSTQNSIFPIFSATPAFGNRKPLETPTTSSSGSPKTTDTVTQSSGFTFTQNVEAKSFTSEIPAFKEISKSPEEKEVTVEQVEELINERDNLVDSTAKFDPPDPPEEELEDVEPGKSEEEVVVTSSPTPSQSQAVSSAAVTKSDSNIVGKSEVANVINLPDSTISSSSASQLSTTTSVFSFSSISFGQTAATTSEAATTTTSIFGQTPKTVSIFEKVSSANTTNVFGSDTPTSSIFGGSTSAEPVFAQASVPSTSAGNIFGRSTSTTSAFGHSSTPTSSPSAFGTKPDAVAQTANIFEQLLSDSNRAGGFGTPATTPTTSTTTSNIFGRSITKTSLFQNNSTFSFFQTSSSFPQSTTTNSNSFFGQNICSPFGGGTSITSSFESGGFNTKPVFGQSLFGQTISNTSIFGGSPTPSIFGGSSSSPSGGSVFQTPTTTSAFGSTSSGPFSSGGGSVAETGFRAATTFQKPLGGFGSPPVFGGTPTSTPAFGASPTFSGSSSFGSPPTFGSRPSVFDSSQGSFGQIAGHSTTFENLANQNTVGFGNLAQQSQSQGFGGFGSSTFENKPAFGGNSFSSWRSK